MIANRTYRYLFFALVILGGLFWIAWGYVLPRYLEHELIPELTRKAGISNLSLRVRNIGFRGVDLGGLQIGNARLPGISVDSVQMDFSLSGLLNRSVERIVLTGLVLRLEVENNRLAINGLDLSPSSGQTAESPSISEIVSQLPVKVVSIPNAIVYYGDAGKSFRLPLSLEVAAASETSEPISVTFELYPRGQRISGNGKVDLEQNQVSLLLSAADLPLGAFSDLIGPASDVSVDAVVDASARATMTLDPFSIDHAKAQLDLVAASLSYGGVQLRNTKDETGADRPIHMALAAVENQQWEFRLSDLVVETPAVDVTTRAAGRISFSDGAVAMAGKLDTAISTAGQVSRGVHSKSIPAISPDAGFGWDISAGLDSDGSWRMNLESFSEVKPKDVILNATFGSWQIRSGSPRIRLSGQGKGDLWSGALEMKIGSLVVSQGGNRINIPEFTVTARSDFTGNSPVPGQVSLRADAPGARVLTDSVKIKVPKVTAQATIMQTAAGGLKATGDLAFSNVSIAGREEPMHLGNLSGTVPIHWPPEGRGSSGKIAARNIRWKDMDLGALTLSVRQKDDRVVISGNHAPAAVFKKPLRVSGDIFPFSDELETRIRIHTPGFVAVSDSVLATVFPQSAGATVAGEIPLMQHYWPRHRHRTRRWA
ncbi:MAG: hypothetical protein JRH15_10100 [Deltaproteobacteria bacterium]|nr:hypothetical protein [Deltaproteobacteria bacterium]